MEKMPDTGPGRPLKYPYSLGAKFLQFPWRMHWKKGRAFRYMAYSILLTMIIFRPIDKLGMYRLSYCNKIMKFK